MTRDKLEALIWQQLAASTWLSRRRSRRTHALWVAFARAHPLGDRLPIRADGPAQDLLSARVETDFHRPSRSSGPTPRA